MAQTFIPILVVFTSVGAYLIGARGLRLSGSGIRKAVGKMLECFGMTFVFIGLNITVGIMAILAVRALTGEFVSLYLAADGSLLALSLVQGLTLKWWWDLSGP